MDKLWAPWRVSYIRSKGQKGCIFCSRHKTQARKQIVFEVKSAFAMLNIFPYNNGHILIAPKRHVKLLSELKDQEALDLFYALKRAQELLDKVLKPQGYNIGINVSKSAGAGIVGHLHIHILPRWQGDTNFMPTLFNTKVISQSLDQLYRQLKDAQSE